MDVKDLNWYCPPGKLTLIYQGVIILVHEDSQTNVKSYHAVRVFIIRFKFLKLKLWLQMVTHFYSHSKRIKLGIKQVDTDSYRQSCNHSRKFNRSSNFEQWNSSTWWKERPVLPWKSIVLLFVFVNK